MSDDIHEGQAPEQDEGQEPNESPVDSHQTPGASDDRAVSELRKEAANYRRQVREMEARLKEYEQAQLSEQERIAAERDQLRADLAEATQRNRRIAVESAVIASASRLGVIDPEIAVALVAGKVDFDEDGLPVGVDEAVADLVKARPYLAAAAAPTIPGAPAANPPKERQSESGKRIYSQSELNDRKFYEAHRDDILAAVSEGRISEE